MIHQIKSILDKIFFAEIGTLSSILSLIITILIYISVKNIKNYYIRKIRLPQLVNKIKENASTISNCLNDFERSKTKIRIELGKIEINLNSLCKRVDRSIKARTKNILKNIKYLSKIELDSEEVRSVNIEVYKIIQAVYNFQEDIELERSL